MRKCGCGLYFRLTLKADIYAIAYIDCILNLKGQFTGYGPNIQTAPEIVPWLVNSRRLIQAMPGC